MYDNKSLCLCSRYQIESWIVYILYAQSLGKRKVGNVPQTEVANVLINGTTFWKWTQTFNLPCFSSSDWREQPHECKRLMKSGFLSVRSSVIFLVSRMDALPAMSEKSRNSVIHWCTSTESCRRQRRSRGDRYPLDLIVKIIGRLRNSLAELARGTHPRAGLCASSVELDLHPD